MKTIAELLRTDPFFAGLPDQSLDVIAGCGVNVHFSPDQRILAENEPADRFYVLRRGKVAIDIDSSRGGPLVIGTLGPGEILGVSWILPPYITTFGARAIEETSAVAIDAVCLRGKCDDDPLLGYALYKRFAGLVRDRLQATRIQLLDLYGSDAS